MLLIGYKMNDLIKDTHCADLNNTDCRGYKDKF